MIPAKTEDESRGKAHIVLSLRGRRQGVAIAEIGQYVFGLDQPKSQMASQSDVESGAGRQGEGVLGGKGHTSNPGTAIQGYVTGMHSSKQSLGKGREAFVTEGKARTKHISKDRPRGVHLGAAGRRSRAEAIGAVAAKVTHKAEITI